MADFRKENAWYPALHGAWMQHDQITRPRLVWNIANHKITTIRFVLLDPVSEHVIFTGLEGEFHVDLFSTFLACGLALGEHIDDPLVVDLDTCSSDVSQLLGRVTLRNAQGKPPAALCCVLSGVNAIALAYALGLDVRVSSSVLKRYRRAEQRQSPSQETCFGLGPLGVITISETDVSGLPEALDLVANYFANRELFDMAAQTQKIGQSLEGDTAHFVRVLESIGMNAVTLAGTPLHCSVN